MNTAHDHPTGTPAACAIAPRFEPLPDAGPRRSEVVFAASPAPAPAGRVRLFSA